MAPKVKYTSARSEGKLITITYMFFLLLSGDENDLDRSHY